MLKVSGIRAPPTLGTLHIRLSHLRDGAQELYSKVQARTKVPGLEKEVAKLCLKLVEVT